MFKTPLFIGFERKFGSILRVTENKGELKNEISPSSFFFANFGIIFP